MRAGPIRKAHDPLVAERLHLLGCQGAVHVTQSQATSTVGSQGVHLGKEQKKLSSDPTSSHLVTIMQEAVSVSTTDLVIPRDDERLVAEVAEDAGQPDLGRELPVQQTEDGPAAEVHVQAHGDAAPRLLANLLPSYFL